jgi:excinuclease ABC subunit C
MDIKEKVKKLPGTAGVYIMKGPSGEILYVGKASNLKRRVSSYFQRSSRLPERIRILVGRVSDITFLPAATEAEALIYENGLIKQLSPKYNVALRDDKSYPMLKLTLNEKFPRLFITRQKKQDGSVYYGPYANAKLLREALVILRQLFPLRSCGRMPKGVCLNYHIRQCLAPCAGKVNDSAYGEIVSELKLFLEGRRAELLGRLSDKMLAASKRRAFEEAAACRARIEALGSLKEKVNYGPSAESDELRAIIGLGKDPDVIEAFDVSNIMGKEAVGSMVCFHRAKPAKSRYRKFRIKTVSGIDDYAMMREIVRRRYGRLMEEKGVPPDLVVIDGGKGHLEAAAAEMADLGLSDVAVIGIAKEFEHIYLKGAKEPLVLPKESKALHLLERIRDEAHRFAIKYHSQMRASAIKYSELDEIAGVGRKRKKALMAHFGSVDKIRHAPADELLEVRGIDEKTARRIIGYFSA